jgi:hypothetical protein
MKTITNVAYVPLVSLSLACYGLLQLATNAFGVVPTPDGSYPGGNTAEGQSALFRLNVSTGTNNTAIGWFSLRSNVDGQFNTAVGAGTLSANTAAANTAVGGAALFSNTTGTNNTANGLLALFSNTIGAYNTAIGTSALQSNTIGRENTATGVMALQSNINGVENTAIGIQALAENLTANENTAVGSAALVFNNGNRNTAIGNNALQDNGSGNDNTAVGSAAGLYTTGNGNVYVGAGVLGIATENNSTRIRNIGSTPIVGGTNVVVSGTGGIGDQVLGFASSSRRYKKDIQLMDEASETLFALKPVTFRAKKNTDSDCTRYYGLIAEEVAKINRDLVVYNREGKPETLRFESINAMLLNEFLKEHRTVQAQECKIRKQQGQLREQEATIAELKKGLQSVVARLKEQDSKIQKVSARLEMQTAPAETVANRR